MYAELFQYKSLPDNYKAILNQVFQPTQFVYVIKDTNGTPKSVTTSVLQAIKKVQGTV
jgi:hypothetical protein